MDDKTIRKLHQDKVQRWDNSSVGAAVGGIMHDAVAVAIAKLNQEKASLITREDYEEEIKFWLDKLYKIAQDKKERAGIPIVEDKPKQINVSKQVEGEKWQSDYNETSELETVNQELNEVENL